MNEQFEIFDIAGNHVGVVSRARVHREGLWHRAANVFLFRSDGRLLIQRRQNSKDVWPGAWDLSVGEHLKMGENFAHAAARGLYEEFGIAHVQLEPLGGVIASRVEVKKQRIKDYEFQRSFCTTFDGDVFPCADEVAEIRFVRLDALAVEVARHASSYTPWFRERAAELGFLHVDTSPT